MQYIEATGLTGLFKVPDMEVDHALITALVERWRPETHTFHLPHEPPPMIPNSNKSTLIGARIKYKWLNAQFAAPLVADADDKVVQQNVRYHLLVRIGVLLFMDKSVDRVSLLKIGRASCRERV